MGQSKAIPESFAPGLPPPLTGGTLERTFSLGDVPTPAALEETLEHYGVNALDWGSGGTKDISNFWKEIKNDEAGLELWRINCETLLLVRVLHVLRAKVTSESFRRRKVFLFNTWQQYGDGRKRTRNGLLSEKLFLNEMPLQDHLHKVCVRAVTQEEMQHVVDPQVEIGPDQAVPAYDPTYNCPLTVVDEIFVDHTIDVESSKSFPGLTTAYHLYTVEIICTGLPNLDFNTLEFAPLDENGNRTLKYIHAWVWMPWPTIQRHLLDGSEMKERIRRDSFKDVSELKRWLQRFGCDSDTPILDLWKAIQYEEVLLEYWRRSDGVPLVMRVVHELQLLISSTDSRQADKFILQEWMQTCDGMRKDYVRPLCRKLNVTRPQNKETLASEVDAAIADFLAHVVDVHVQLDPGHPPRQEDLPASGIVPVRMKFHNHRFDLKDAKPLPTMHHYYTVEVVCDGLPNADFSTLAFYGNRGLEAYGWHWVTWPQVLDLLRAKTAQTQPGDREREVEKTPSSRIGTKALTDLDDMITELSLRKSPADRDVSRRLREIRLALTETADDNFANPISSRTSTSASKDSFPPSMISAMSDRSLMDDSYQPCASLSRSCHDDRVSMRS